MTARFFEGHWLYYSSISNKFVLSVSTRRFPFLSIGPVTQLTPEMALPRSQSSGMTSGAQVVTQLCYLYLGHSKVSHFSQRGLPAALPSLQLFSGPPDTTPQAGLLSMPPPEALCVMPPIHSPTSEGLLPQCLDQAFLQNSLKEDFRPAPLPW